MTPSKALTALLATGVLLGAAPAGAAILVNSTTLNVNAYVTGKGTYPNGFTTSLTAQSSNSANSPPLSLSLGQISYPFPAVAPGSGYAPVSAITTQSVSTSAAFHLSNSFDSTTASAACAADGLVPCSTYTAGGAGEYIISFELTTPYAYEFDLYAQKVSASGTVDVGSSGYLYSQTALSQLWTGSVALDETSAASTFLKKTGLLDPGIYTVSLLGQDSVLATGVGVPPSTSLLFGIANLDFKLTPVPLPAAVWLLLSGLAGMGLLTRRKVALAVR